MPIPADSVFERKPGAEGFDTTLQDHVAFQRIVTFARQTFGTSAGVLTIFDGDQQYFLADSGLTGPKAMPREISFCSNTMCVVDCCAVADSTDSGKSRASVCWTPRRTGASPARRG